MGWERNIYSKKFLVIVALVFVTITTLPSIFHYHMSVDGGYSEWSRWSHCSRTCGSALRGRYRNCSNPPPAGLGKLCVYIGPHVETVSCKSLPPCPVDGDWSIWGAWQKCDRNCVDGKQIRTRECNDPRPSNGGLECLNPSSSKEERNCETLIICPIDGGWNEWSAWSTCSATCGKGTTERGRKCENPVPKYSGKHCEGIPHEMKECTLVACVLPTNSTILSNNATLSNTTINNTTMSK